MVRWVPDRTGRFRQRPHYEPAELDRELGAVVVGFLLERYGKVAFPISTEDLTVLIERDAVLDLYADLSREGADVEGVTYFGAKRPVVRIASRLSTEPRMRNRFRTTLTHEFTHVRLHSFLFPFAATAPGTAEASAGDGPRCRRETILSPASTDWMEWQAAYGCGALLMPAAAVHRLVGSLHLGSRPLVAIGRDANEAIRAVMETFLVSEDAARVRLFKLDALRAAEVQAVTT